MHATLEGKCVAEIVFAHPILQALFTFLQMHFLFVNSEVLVEKFGLLARFGFMHLIATNVSLWIRTVVWESANEWLHYLHHQHIHSGLHSAGSYSAIVASHQVGRPAVYQPAADYAYFDDEEFDSANTLDYASGIVRHVRILGSYDVTVLLLPLNSIHRRSKLQSDGGAHQPVPHPQYGEPLPVLQQQHPGQDLDLFHATLVPVPCGVQVRILT